MSEGQHVNRVLGRIVSIEGYESGIAEVDQQLAQFGYFGIGATHIR